MTVYELPWMKIAKGEVGVKEKPGSGDNQRVLEYHKLGAPKLSAQSDSVPWCAAFVGWVLRTYGAPITGEAAARSYLTWGYKIPSFRPGCIVVMKRGDSSWQGHVGFGVETGLFSVKVLGGNQNDEVNISSYPRSKILGYRWSKYLDSAPIKGLEKLP
jgi:uncharacterized protein (TIGR02594 family)